MPKSNHEMPTPVHEGPLPSNTSNRRCSSQAYIPGQVFKGIYDDPAIPPMALFSFARGVGPEGLCGFFKSLSSGFVRMGTLVPSGFSRTSFYDAMQF